MGSWMAALIQAPVAAGTGTYNNINTSADIDAPLAKNAADCRYGAVEKAHKIEIASWMPGRHLAVRTRRILVWVHMAAINIVAMGRWLLGWVGGWVGGPCAGGCTRQHILGGG